MDMYNEIETNFAPRSISLLKRAGSICQAGIGLNVDQDENSRSNSEDAGFFANDEA